MTTFAAQPETERRLAELDALTRTAWGTYREELRELAGRSYDVAEAAAWEQLQATLRELESERSALAAAPTSG
ncbi:MAG TPA: hypothetical protein VL120_18250 [Solirubrobacteraceae bacterium]|jgi:hypothetical protein|nr:hypothetical protein [Solirubrobacteraceae bacterium]